MGRAEARQADHKREAKKAARATATPPPPICSNSMRAQISALDCLVYKQALEQTFVQE